MRNRNFDLNKDKEVQSIKKIEKKEWFKLFVLISTICLIFYFYISYQNHKQESVLKYINSNYSLIKAKIVSRSTYKIWTITVEYKVKNTRYRESRAVNNNNLKVGDSIWIKYSNMKPNLIIIDTPDSAEMSTQR
jgi:hypothetical protein